MKELIQVAYVSVEARPLFDSELRHMLVTFRNNNEQHNITGMLLKIDKGFLQIIEGPESEVAQLWENLCKDQRHKLVTEIYRKSILQRCFEDWCMAFEYNQSKARVFADGFVEVSDTIEVLKSRGLDDALVDIINKFCEARK